ncbi:MAG: flagellar biosynthetic protein FliQ [Thermoguttaceae bacterium]|nr:flagellar biosynthetic protein FliQ [Thermoguttaceae bacterium]
MDSDLVVTLAREGLQLALLVAAPVLLTGVIVGALVGLVQTVMQVQDQTVAFVVKISSMILAFAVCLPWIVGKVVEYSRILFENIPETTTVFFQ